MHYGRTPPQAGGGRSRLTLGSLRDLKGHGRAPMEEGGRRTRRASGQGVGMPLIRGRRLNAATPRALRRAFRRGAVRVGLRPLQIAVLLAVVACGLAASALLAAQERAGQRTAQQAWAGRAAATLDDEVAAAGAALTSARGLFAAVGHDVDPAAFARFATVELQGSQMLSLNWAPRVRAASRARFERELGRPITETPPGGSVRPAAARAEYFPLALVAPAIPATEALLGSDVASTPILLPSLLAARDGGRPVMTQALSLDAAGIPTTVALMTAVYGPDPSPGTTAARRATLRGYFGGLFGIARLAESALALLPEGSRLQIVSSGARVFDSGTGPASRAASGAPVGTTGWSVSVALDQGPAVRTLPVAVITGGSLAVALLLGVLFAQANQRRRERERGRARLQHEADTDGLTGLANRRRLERDLATALALAHGERPLALVLLDLNGFKGYNDRFGHPAGDALLVRLSARLRDAVPGGRVYRLGGDEFCVLAPVGAVNLMGVVESCLAALTDGGEGFAITAAHGVALIPADATTAEGAMLTADHRMYARKALGRQSAGSQSADVLICALAERSPDLGDHTRGVADLVDRVAQRLGLDESERGPVRQAALLHDVGKVAIPDAILQKAAALDPGERAFIERHTVIGERILRAAPSLEAIAPLVRSSHERWDGTGYPDGLAGEEIPLGSRIVFACDALDAMTSPTRPYREPMSREAALDELDRCAGSQFDPRVITALVAVVREQARCSGSAPAASA